ncbi:MULTISPECIES: LysR family transcriptional regulator [Pseudomonas]|uniref:Transcriptional regulator, LysR family n=1 Tax=Pseudomonas fulva (strain 12-X) TaxID=743720 RepID=F6AJI0_PSEF1|nr:MULTISPECIES: LysR family transcriptional regulator [Pseudomonas]AEF21761.1 transcriptional regulator, LysR family [Pseudomonas fulva 12-X]PZW64378.1 DNA-binding transcriptional LysR family regulator [Pseudomonas sp. URMO17WK12:I1]
MDKLLALKAFVETVRCGGFSAAGRSLGVATSSVTRLVSSLEAELQSVLVNRSPRQVSVTEAGQAYFVRAVAILEALEEADAAITDRGNQARGRLNVSVPVEFGRRIIAPRLGRLLERHPQLELNLRLNDEVVDLLGERVDVAVRLGSTLVSDDVVSLGVGQFQRWLVASPKYLACREPLSAPQDLMAHDCLRFDYGAAGRSWQFSAGGEIQQVAVRGRLHSNNADVLREAALAGQGVALLADWLVREDVASGRLLRVLESYAVSPGSASGAISVLYLPNQRGSRRVAAFVEFLREVLAG